jgi:spore germination protein GerM
VSRVRQRLALLATAGVALLALAACGIPQDSAPREISRDALPPELIDPASTASSAAEGAERRVVTLYLVQGDDTSGEVLVPVRREVVVPDDRADLPRVVAEQLIAASPEQLGRTDLVNAVPRDVQVRAAEVGDDGVLELDLANLGNAESALQRLAVAQLVFTLTELTDPSIDAIRFSVDGAEVTVPIENGVAPAGTAVDRGDEPSFIRGTRTTTR